VPIVYLLVYQFDFGPTGIWIGMAAGQIIGAVAASAWFTRGTWKEAVVDGDDEGESESESEDADPAA
jgi:Na+-driven multidrug efflux pump